MALFNFTKAERDVLVNTIREYASRELEQELSPFEAGFLLNFFAEEIGPHFYNKGLQDAQAVLSKRLDEITGAIESLEKPTIRRR